jgi:hypothetical protein
MRTDEQDATNNATVRPRAPVDGGRRPDRATVTAPDVAHHQFDDQQRSTVLCLRPPRPDTSYIDRLIVAPDGAPSVAYSNKSVNGDVNEGEAEHAGHDSYDSGSARQCTSTAGSARAIRIGAVSAGQQLPNGRHTWILTGSDADGGRYARPRLDWLVV